MRGLQTSRCGTLVADSSNGGGQLLPYFVILGHAANRWHVRSNLPCMKKSYNERLFLGEAGEHLVLVRLLRRRILVSQAPRAWADDDILGIDGLRIQVKATDRGVEHGWM